MNQSNKNSLLISINQLIAGIGKHFATASMAVANQTYTGTQLVAVLQSLADLITATIASNATWQNDVAAEKKAFASSDEFLSSLQQAVYAAYGNSVATLADFGLKPRTRQVPSTSGEGGCGSEGPRERKKRGVRWARTRRRRSRRRPARPGPRPRPRQRSRPRSEHVVGESGSLRRWSMAEGPRSFRLAAEALRAPWGPSSGPAWSAASRARSRAASTASAEEHPGSPSSRRSRPP
jgi:hypothetical protein